MVREYITSCSEFFYIAGVPVTLIETGWQAIIAEETRLLCLNNLEDQPDVDQGRTSLVIGHRYENGDGLHCRIIIERTTGDVSFETDIIGGVPAFWFSTDEIVIVASSLKLLVMLAKDLGIKLKPNQDAFSELLIASYIYSKEHTAVEDVEVLPPKSRLIINNENNKIEISKIAGEFRYADKPLTWEQAKQEFKQGLRDGFQRLKGKKVACLLSGGADSRIVAVSAVDSGIDVDFFTFGQSTVNISDFYIANQVAYRLNKKTRCFSTSAEVFLENWKKSCADSNWINDSVWWAGRIPRKMFAELAEYDVMIRGDGDGIYGWKTAIANVSDILHRLEISEIAATRKYWKYFVEPRQVFEPAQISRSKLVKKYEKPAQSLRDLTNILYQDIRETKGTAPGVWHFSGITAVDAPLLWQKSLDLASKIPSNKRYNKQIIFEVLKTFESTKDVCFSSASSRDNQLEFYYSGVWEYLLEYIRDNCPVALNYESLYGDYVRPSATNSTALKNMKRLVKKMVLVNKFGRKVAFKYFPHRAHSSIAERLIIRLAVIANLCETLRKDNHKRIVKTPFCVQSESVGL